ncbi:hypothetical protein DFQ27_008285 [Actinomortierella ambigua]|uniref:type I protein arginine methyltransferase n=1 Tax=Actinomortierella ambigua TaxID=1343610 RepID=A0A9P6QKF0_9FUNG|nr:hypothetical protein DFQ27_008285 [Actinomortierella ambigua]
MSRILQDTTVGSSSGLFEARRPSTFSQAYSQSEYSESELGEQDNGWDDWEEEEGMNVPCKCLFCPIEFPSAKDVFDHCTSSHGFDFLKTRRTLGLDFYQSIRLINYLRKQAQENPAVEKTTSFELKSKDEAFLSEDSYLLPVMEDDALLYAFEDLDIVDVGQVPLSPTLTPEAESQRQQLHNSTRDIVPTTDLEARLLKQLHQLEERLFATEVQLRNAETQFQDYRNMVKENFFDTLDDGARSVFSDTSSVRSGKASGAVVKVPRDEGNYYFNSYAHRDIHQQMLNDRVRTEGYRDFIYENKDVFKGKTVLDVGCGTGILSMFAAKSGAAKVYSVDNSDIIEKARANIKENGLDNIITLFRGRIEEIKLPSKVDIIISEWMGYFLLYEAMLDSVLVARDRFLVEGGLLAPSQTRILLTATSDETFVDENIHYWTDVYGFKMSAMQDGTLREALVDVVQPKTIVTTTVSIKDLPLQTITVPDLDFVSDFCLEMTRDDVLAAFVGYFDTWFTRDGADVPLDVGISPAELTKNRLNGFTTGPVETADEETHWKQTMFVLEKPLQLKKGDQVKGTFYCLKNVENPRALDLRIVYEVKTVEPSTGPAIKDDLTFYLR